jgi:hypothetical protein
MNTIAKMTIRSIAVAAAMLAIGSSANALTIPANSLVANSVQAFSQEALDAFDVASVTVTPLGNATAGAAAGAFVMPITSITVGSGLKITNGEAKGSALEIARLYRGAKLGIVLANFSINYTTKQVLADTTTLGGSTVKQAPVYNFNVATPLAIKYKFPMNITGHEVLDQLTLTPEMSNAMAAGLGLSTGLRAAMDSIATFGSLTQDVSVKMRPKAVSAKAYVATP